MSRAKPFVKWAGGKSQLIPEIDPLFAQILSTDRGFQYIEPFIGGGAIFFHVLNRFPQIERGIINDINPDLIAVYQTLRDTPKPLIEGLKEIEEDYYRVSERELRKAFYLNKREEFNRNKQDKILRSVLFIFLNKTCFNGLYRVNSKGKFNVPFGDYAKPVICDEGNLLSVSEQLQNVEILLGDFEETLSYIGPNTIFYIDPPYKPIGNTSSFTSYTKEDFGDADQNRLKEFCDRLHQKGGKFILSNSDVKNLEPENNFFDILYQEYSIKRVKAKRCINSKGQNRGAIWELLISNFRL